MTSFYPFTQAGFAAVTFLYYGVFAFCYWKSIRKTKFSESKQRTIFFITFGSLLLWLAITSILSKAGVFRNFDVFPPPFFILLIVPLVAVIFFTSRSTTLEILKHIPPHQLIYLQSFRVLVEILLWMLFVDNLLPIQMTFEGRNFDILAGLTSIAMGCLVSRGRVSKTIALVWNVACLGLLINIVTIAILSTPTPLRVFMNDPANRVVAEFPIVWLPAALVPLAYGLHILSIRQLLQKRDM